MNYVVDIEAYTEAFCENIDQPELKCHGTCHLTKVLAKSEEEKKGNQESSPPAEILQLYLPASDDLQTGAEPEENTRILFYYCETLPQGALLSTFHPPDFTG